MTSTRMIIMCARGRIVSASSIHCFYVKEFTLVCSFINFLIASTQLSACLYYQRDEFKAGILLGDTLDHPPNNNEIHRNDGRLAMCTH